MAKANVLARRIRAYERRIDGLIGGQQVEPPNYQDARQREARRLRGELAQAKADFEAFLFSREKGPWAAYAKVLAGRGLDS